MPEALHNKVRALLGARRRKLTRLLLVLKTCGFVCAIAKRLVCGVSTAAKDDRAAASETIYLALHIDDFEIPFDAQRAVISNSDPG